jgi:hypothetical protein
MRKMWIVGIGVATLLLAAVPAMATTINFTNLNSVPQYAGEYVGPLQATLDSAAISGGVACVDIAHTTYVPSSYAVNISTLNPVNMSTARFGSDAAAILKYQEAAWLLGQIQNHSTEVGVIQFATWKIFNPAYVDTWIPGHGGDIDAVNSWVAQAEAINPANYDFSSVRIYTPTAASASNQEFMSGVAGPVYGASPVPVPGSVLLLGTGLLGLLMLRKTRRS